MGNPIQAIPRPLTMRELWLLQKNVPDEIQKQVEMEEDRNFASRLERSPKVETFEKT